MFQQDLNQLRSTWTSIAINQDEFLTEQSSSLKPATHVQFYLIKPSWSIEMLHVDGKTNILHELIEVWQIGKILMAQGFIFDKLSSTMVYVDVFILTNILRKNVVSSLLSSCKVI